LFTRDEKVGWKSPPVFSHPLAITFPLSLFWLKAERCSLNAEKETNVHPFNELLCYSVS
jgi:hypothetical protein